MEDFDFKVRNFIRKNQLIPYDSRVLVGVSGGPDSLALLHFLNTYKREYNIQLTVAHVDHMLRGEESEQEFKYVERICKEWGIPFEGIHMDVKKEMELKSGSSEVIAREVRYNFFQSVMQKSDIPLLALAHHGDDQIETILMRLTRGSGLKATAGIQASRPFANGVVIRPFLTVTKDEIEKYIEDHQLQPVYDPTNKLDIYTRNRYRNTILPFLKQENPNVHLHFQRFSEQLIEDENYLMDLAKEAYTKIVYENDNNSLSLNITEFSEVALPLQRRCIQLILNYLYQGEIPGNLASVHVESIIQLVTSRNPSGSLNLPSGLNVVRSYQTCLFSFNKHSSESFFYKWNKGETLTLPNGSRLIMETGKKEYDEDIECFRLDSRTQFPLIVRTRENGDRIQLKGMKGSKKIKSLFIDHKIPKLQRDEWPIVTDKNGNIIWVPMLRKSIYEEEKQKDGQSVILKYIKS